MVDRSEAHTNVKGCVEKFKHPTIREEERVRNIAHTMETLGEYNKSHDNYCCRCQKTVEETVNDDENNYIYYHVLTARSLPTSMDVQHKKRQ